MRSKTAAAFRARYKKRKTRRAPWREGSSKGFSLLDLLIVLGVSGIVLTVGTVNLFRLSGRLRLELACAEVVTALRTTQFHSYRHSEYVGLKFWTQQRKIRWGVYSDGDDDGVRTADIQRGIDPPVQRERTARRLGPTVWFGFPEGLRPRDPSDPRRRLTRLQDPIRFGRSDIASFSHLGTSSPGTVYLTNGWDLAAVRVTNRSGRVRILHYDRETEQWQ